jgi:hypothetical protein
LCTFRAGHLHWYLIERVGFHSLRGQVIGQSDVNWGILKLKKKSDFTLGRISFTSGAGHWAVGCQVNWGILKLKKKSDFTLGQVLYFI